MAAVFLGIQHQVDSLVRFRLNAELWFILALGSFVKLGFSLQVLTQTLVCLDKCWSEGSLVSQQ